MPLAVNIDPNTLTQPPRNVAYTQYALIFRACLWVACVLLLVITFVSQKPQFEKLKALKEHGVAASAQVLGGSDNNGKPPFRLHVMFQANGTNEDEWMKASSDDYYRAQARTKIPVTYLPSDPSVRQIGTVTQSTLDSFTSPHLIMGIYLIVICALAIGVIEWRMRQEAKLLRDGILIAGVILPKIASQGSSARTVRYAFEVDGSSYSGSGFITKAKGPLPDVGSQVPVLYLKTNPKSNSLLTSFMQAQLV
jgi:hypothetical protein